MIYVIATIEVAAGRRDEFLKHFHNVAPKVRSENGCLEYEPTIDAETPIAAQVARRENVVTIVEKWQDLAALQAHLVAPHMQEYRAQVKSLVQNVSLQILEPA